MEDFLGSQNLQGEQISKDYYIVVTYVKTRMERWGLRNVNSQWGGGGCAIRILKNLKGDQVNFIVTTKVLQTLFPSPPPLKKKKKKKKTGQVINNDCSLDEAACYDESRIVVFFVIVTKQVWAKLSCFKYRVRGS